jgi:hypothetical protein
MTGARELFESFTESDSDVHVELGMGTKHVVKGSWNSAIPDGVRRHVESEKCTMGAKTQEECDLLVSTIEKKGFDVLFRDGKALIKPRGSSSDTTIVLGVRERNLYRIKGHPM